MGGGTLKSPALLAAVLLAGCSALAPPPAPEASPPTPTSLPVRTLTPTLPREPARECVELSIEPAGHAEPQFAFARSEWLAFDVRLHSSCEAAVALAYGGRCPRELFTLDLLDTQSYERAALDGSGAAYPEGGPCPDPAGAPEEPPSLPAGYTLSRLVAWNATLAAPCPQAPRMECHAAAPTGSYEAIVVAYGAGGEVWTAQWSFFLHEFCADLTFEVPAPMHARLVVDNRTEHEVFRGPAEPQPRMRWCGEPGVHWVRYQDVSTGKDEAGAFAIEAHVMVVRAFPLEVAPADLWWS